MGYRRFLLSLQLLIATLAFGTISFYLVEGMSLFDSLYMTIITISTVGFSEIKPLSTYGRIITIIIITTGVTIGAYTLGQLDVLRNRIDTVDSELLETLASRVAIVKEIAQYKKHNNVTALQINRWTQLMDDRVNLGKKMDLNETFVKILFQLIHEDSVRMQTEIMDEE